MNLNQDGGLSKTEAETSLSQALDFYQKQKMIVARINTMVVARIQWCCKLYRIHKIDI